MILVLKQDKFNCCGYCLSKVDLTRYMPSFLRNYDYPIFLLQYVPVAFMEHIIIGNANPIKKYNAFKNKIVE